MAVRSSGGASGRREMKNELVTVVDEPVAVDRLVVTDRQIHSAACLAVDRDRLHPVDGVLQFEVRPRRLRDVEGRPRIGGLGSDVQKERPLFVEGAARARHPLTSPLEISLARERVGIRPIADAQVVGGRSHDRRHGGRRQRPHHLDAVAEIEPERRTAVLDGGVGSGAGQSAMISGQLSINQGANTKRVSRAIDWLLTTDY